MTALISWLCPKNAVVRRLEALVALDRARALEAEMPYGFAWVEQCGEVVLCERQHGRTLDVLQDAA